jgi:hypothetical protein
MVQDYKLARLFAKHIEKHDSALTTTGPMQRNLLALELNEDANRTPVASVARALQLLCLKATSRDETVAVY